LPWPVRMGQNQKIRPHFIKKKLELTHDEDGIKLKI